MDKSLYDLLTSLACHELRTPLTTVYGYGQMIYAKEKADPKVKTWSKEILAQSKRLQEIIDQLQKTSGARLSTLNAKPEDLVNTAILALTKGVEAVSNKAEIKKCPGKSGVVAKLQITPHSTKLSAFEKELKRGLLFLLCVKLLELGNFKLKTMHDGKSLDVAIKS